MSAKTARVVRSALGAAAITALAVALGCGAFGSGKGFVSVRGGKVVALELTLEGAENGVCPGSVHQIAITATTRRGQKITSWRQGENGAPAETKGHLDYNDFKVEVAGGRVDKEGRFEAHPDALYAAVTGYKIAIAIADTGTPAVELSFPTRLDCLESIDLRGAAGKAGAVGAAGKAAEADASVPVAEAPAPAIGGGFTAPTAADATADGLPGEDGGFGKNAVDAEVASTIVSTPFHTAAVLVRVTPKDKAPLHFLADPSSPDGFAIDCRGGDGGRGGEGGPGGIAGAGGDGGGGGDGGDGAGIRGFFDVGQLMLQSYMKYLFQGGAAGEKGRGGAPGERDAEGRPMLPGREGSAGQPGRDGPLPDVRPEGGVNLFPDLPEGVYVLPAPWVPGQTEPAPAPASLPPAQAP